MRILVSGANGQLGTDLVDTFSEEHQVLGFTREDCDITKTEKTVEYITSREPDLIIHSAAFTDVDGCEEEEDRAFRVNGLGARNVAVAASEVGAKMVYVSTDYVFAGNKSGVYREDVEPAPRTVYGKSKLLGEKYVKEQVSEHFICRIAWLYGSHGENFLQTMLGLARSEEEIEVVEDQIGSPTWTKSIANQLQHLVRTRKYGTYHCTSRGSCSWYEFAREIFLNAGFQVTKNLDPGIILSPEQGDPQFRSSTSQDDIGLVKLIPVSSVKFERTAPRPKNSVLENYMLNLEGLNNMPHWKDSLEEFMAESGEDVI